VCTCEFSLRRESFHAILVDTHHFTMGVLQKPPHIRRSSSEAMASKDEGTIGTFRGKHAANPHSWCTNYQCFLHRQEQDGQDRAFQLWGGLMNYKAHGDLSWFNPLLGSNSPTSSCLILLKINNCCKGVSRELKKFTWWRGKWISYPLLEG
jgi:hypothetical protein